MIQFICFDLDNTLADLAPAHYFALNTALREVAGEYFVISATDHQNEFNGLPTKTKLSMLTNRGLNPELFPRIIEQKQELTLQYIKNNLTCPDNVFSTISNLFMDVKLACVSNAVRNTVESALLKMGIIGYFDIIISNEDCKKNKPDPEPYLYAMQLAGAKPSETLIVEDSLFGIQSGMRSGAHVYVVKDPQDLSLDKIIMYLEASK